MNYLEIEPITTHIKASRQDAKRHYGVHPYFTRRPYNVVRDYLIHYSDVGDTILDPFGGSGVTAIESYLENRIGIQNDINPLANFISNSIHEISKVSDSELNTELIRIEKECKKSLDTIKNINNEDELNNIFNNLRLPDNISLPSNSDAKYLYDLFSKKHLLSLALLKNKIDEITNYPLKSFFLLAWSACLSKLNKTFISTKGRAESRGGSSIFSIYRYKIAKNPIELDAWECFYSRLNNIANARREILNILSVKRNNFTGKYISHNLDIDELHERYFNSIDYIFTDPPYGGNISYIDLSIMWNAWLGIIPEEALRNKELIVGGELNFSEEYYINKLYVSVKYMFEMLKDNRWLSLVFQHWKIDYFKAILNAAKDSNAELKSAVSQLGDPIWSMHKKKGNTSVLSGELILTFLKKSNSKIELKTNGITVDQIIGNFLSNYHGEYLYSELLFNQLIIKTWENGIIDKLKINKDDIKQILENNNWLYDEKNHYWVNKENQQSLF